MKLEDLRDRARKGHFERAATQARLGKAFRDGEWAAFDRGYIRLTENPNNPYGSRFRIHVKSPTEIPNPDETHERIALQHIAYVVDAAYSFVFSAANPAGEYEMAYHVPGRANVFVARSGKHNADGIRRRVYVSNAKDAGAFYAIPYNLPDTDMDLICYKCGLRKPSTPHGPDPRTPVKAPNQVVVGIAKSSGLLSDRNGVLSVEPHEFVHPDAAAVFTSEP